MTSECPISVRHVAVIWMLACGWTISAQAQDPLNDWSIRAGGGLGVGLAAMPGLADYVNVVAASAQPVDEIVSVAELSAFGEFRIADAWSAGLTWGRVVKTLEPSGSGGWTFDASLATPMFFVRHAVDAVGMRLQVAAGAGPARGELTQRFGAVGSEQHFSGSGIGLMTGAAIFAPLDDHLVAGISADVRWTGVTHLRNAAGQEPTHRGVTADLRWTQLTLHFLIATQF